MIPKIEIHFTITGSFDPDKFTEVTELKPTNTWKTGEKVQKTLITRKHDGWKLSTAETNSHDLDVEINKLISLLEPYKLQITNFCKESNLNIEFSCVINTEDNEFPSIHFDKKLIDNIKSFNAEIDIDIY